MLLFLAVVVLIEVLDDGGKYSSCSCDSWCLRR